MKQVKEWETSDGERFTDRSEAKAHEGELLTLTKLGALLKNSVQTNRVEAVLRHIVLEHDMVRTILASHAKSLPRKKQEQEAKAA